jgi:hypothetical protein
MLSAVAGIQRVQSFLRKASAALLQQMAAVSRGRASCTGPGITRQSTRTSYRPAFAGLCPPVISTLCLGPLNSWFWNRNAILSGCALRASWPRGCEGCARYERLEPPSVAVFAGSSADANSAYCGEAQNRCRFGAAAMLRAVAGTHRVRMLVREAYAAFLRRVAAVSRGHDLCIGSGITWQSTRTSYRPAFAGLLSAGHFYVMPLFAEHRFVLPRPRAMGAPCTLLASRTTATALASVAKQVPLLAWRPVGRPGTAVGSASVWRQGLPLMLRLNEASFWGSRCTVSSRSGSLKRQQPPVSPWHNMAIDTDVLSAGVRRPTVRRSFLRYASVRWVSGVAAAVRD